MRHRPTCTFRTARRARAGSRNIRHPRTPTVMSVGALALVLALTACGTEGTSPTAAGRTSAAPPGFPVTVTNCGVETTYQHPPRRAVTLNQHATEVMLALGLEGHMVGTAFRDDRILPKYRQAYRQLPVLAEEYPSYEKLLQAAPDFVYGGYASAFSEREGRSRQRLRQAGIDTHLNAGECAGGPVTMERVRHELRTIATVFGVQKRAARLIDELDTELATAERRLDEAEPVSVFVFDSGRQAPLTAGGHGIANEIVRLAGGRNVFAGIGDSFVDVSWEQVIERRPERIVILDYGSTSAEQKKRYLLNNPALADVPAIKHRRFAVVPLSSVVVGVRAPHAVTDLAQQLHPERFR